MLLLDNFKIVCKYLNQIWYEICCSLLIYYPTSFSAWFLLQRVIY